MIITRKNFDILKQAATAGGFIYPGALQAIAETEKAAEDANRKNAAYILEKRKTNKNYCR